MRARAAQIFTVLSIGASACLTACAPVIVNPSTRTTAALSISPSTFTLAVGNSKSFAGSGGTAPYSYSIVSGGGTISGSTGLYTAPGSAGSATIRVTDAALSAADATITINSALSATPSSITITAGAGYTYTFSGQNGVPGYTYNLQSGPGSVVGGTGVYTAGSSSGTSTLQIQDAIGNSVTSQINNIRVRTNGTVGAAVSNGVSWYLAGSFTSVNPHEAPKALAVDITSGDPVLSCDWKTGFNGNIRAMLVSGGSLYVGGEFTTYQGQPANYLAKLSASTCDLDTTFTQATGANNRVFALALSGGYLYFGGEFSNYRGGTAQRLAKVDATTGALDTTFTQATGASDYVQTLALSGSSLYVGGAFTTYRGSTANYLAKVDSTSGALDTTFTQATGASNYVQTLALSGSSLYVGGGFTTYRGSTAQRLAKIDATSGALDTTFTQATGANSWVYALTLSGSSLYVGGGFTTYRGSTAQRLAKIDATSGALDTTFTQATGPNNVVFGLALSGSSLYIGGAFTNYRGSTANYLAKVDTSTGVLDTTFTQATGVSNWVIAFALSGSSLYVGGNFAFYRGSAANYLAKIDATTGVLDTTFTQATGPSNTVGALALSGSSLYIGGGFTTYRGTTANYLAKVDATSGALDTTFTQATGADSAVNALALSGSSLYIGGYFTTYRGGAANYLAKIDATSGALDTTFTQATGADNGVRVIALSGSSLYVGGDFTDYRGGAANYLAKIDATSGALDTTFTQASGAVSLVYALALSGSSLYVGGVFTAYRGTTANYLAKVDVTTGALDTTFTQVTGAGGIVNALALSGSSLYVGGQFTTYRGGTAQRLVKIDATTGALDTTFTQATGASNYVYALTVAGSSLYVGGDFTTYRGARAYYFFPVDLTSGASGDP